MADLVIKISGDVKDYKSALAQAEKGSEDLENALGNIGKVSAVAFAALTGEILFASKAFGESQAASNKLTQALQNQGIYSSELTNEYKKRASALQTLTGIDDDSIVAAQASLQAMIGQAKVTDGLTQAIVDLSVAKGMDLTTTAELIGKGIQGHVGALQKLGIEIDEHLSKEERTARIIELVGQKFGGQAEAANKGLGALKGLQSAFGDLQEEIGGRFAPIIEAAIRGMTSFISTISSNQPLMDFITASIAAGTVVAALGTTVGVAGTAFLALRSILTAVGATMSVTRAAAIALGSATGIGLIAFAVAELALNWQTVWPKMQQIFQAFVTNISGLAGGVGNVLGGMLNFSPAQVKAGMDQVKSAVQAGYAEISAAVKPINVGSTESGETQDSGKAAAAEAEAAREIEAERNKQGLLAAERELGLLKLGEASAQEIALAQNKIETLKALQTQTDSEIKEALYAHLEEIQAIQSEANDLSFEQQFAFHEELLASSAEYQALDSAQQGLFLQQNADKLRQSLETEKSIKLQYAQLQLQEDIKRRNQFLLDEQKFGVAYATINQAMNSNEFTAAQTATQQLIRLSNSKNNELKAIGKAAAVSQIGIDTAKGAMAVYANFQTAIPYPPVSIPLGIAAAGAVIAYGGERISGVLAAAEGGLISGGIPGVDSVPAMLMPGELVTPARNFEEVVNAVANQRAGQNQESSSGGIAEVVISLKDDLVDFIEARLIERQRLNISMAGA